MKAESVFSDHFHTKMKQELSMSTYVHLKLVFNQTFITHEALRKINRGRFTNMQNLKISIEKHFEGSI